MEEDLLTRAWQGSGATDDTTHHPDKLLAYFNGLGFERWLAIRKTGV